MANFSTILLAIFMVMFWIFRAAVALCTQYSINFLVPILFTLSLSIATPAIAAIAAATVVTAKTAAAAVVRI